MMFFDSKGARCLVTSIPQYPPPFVSFCILLYPFVAIPRDRSLIGGNGRSAFRANHDAGSI